MSYTVPSTKVRREDKRHFLDAVPPLIRTNSHNNWRVALEVWYFGRIFPRQSTAKTVGDGLVSFVVSLFLIGVYRRSSIFWETRGN